MKSDETVNAKEESQNEAVLRKESENLKTDPVIEKAFCNAEPLDKADDTSISEKTLVAHENTELENNKKDNSNEEMEKLETEKSNNSEDATVKVEDCLCEGDNNKDELKKNVDEEINKELTEVEVKGEELNQKEILNTTKENFIESKTEILDGKF